MSERLHTLPDNRITLLRVGPHTVRRRPHYGCGDCPWVYDILDPRGHTMRSIVSHPSSDDCATAIRLGGEAKPTTVEEVIRKLRDRDERRLRGKRVAERAAAEATR